MSPAHRHVDATPGALVVAAFALLVASNSAGVISAGIQHPLQILSTW
jgi:hypothetical protein